MKKFPIIKNGINYEVIIEEYYGEKDFWEVYLNTYTIRSFFGLFSFKTKNKLFKNIYGLKTYAKHYIDVTYLKSLDFIEMATDIINQYESTISRNEKERILNQKAIKEFEEWNGNLDK